MDALAERPTGQLAAEIPGAWSVLLRHRIDFCCRGATSLREAARRSGVDPERVLAELDALRAVTTSGEEWTRWNDADATRLIAWIEENCHRAALDDLPWLADLAAELEEAEAAQDSRLKRVAVEVRQLRDELRLHVIPLERQLFAAIRRGVGYLCPGQVRALNRDHRGVADTLSRLQDLTDDHHVRTDASTRRRDFARALRELDLCLRLQMHLENNLLFPTALLR